MKEIFRLTSILFGSQKGETPVPAGVPINEAEEISMATVPKHSRQQQEEFVPPVVPSGHARARAERWLEARLKRAQKEQFAELGELTPELAYLLWERNKGNRTFGIHTAQTYARDIAADRWENNGETIILSDTGEVNDGQHRIAAVLIAWKPIPVWFVFGVSRASRLTTDQGKSKTAGHYLSMQGVSNANNLATIAANLIEVERVGKIANSATDRATKSEIRERVISDPAIAESFHIVGKPGAARIAPKSVLATAHYLFAKSNKVEADYFITKLIDGAELKSRDPIFVVREKLSARDARLTKNEQMKALIMAWNNFRARRTVRTLTHKMDRGEKLPGVK